MSEALKEQQSETKCLPRMRTIKGAVEHFKKLDPDTIMKEHLIRNLLWTKKIPFHKAGSKYIINLDVLEEYLKNPPPHEVEKVIEYGKLRKIN